MGCQPVREGRKQMEEQNRPDGTQDYDSWASAGDRQELNKGALQNTGKSHYLEAPGTAKGRGEKKVVCEGSY